MRLTLRTMLAYLDNILDAGDAEQLRAKIEESKVASDLVHRIRNSTRRLRLAAPKLDGKGIGLDPNTVAEYLDNTLPPERVSEFERVCLESDVHLAEVASCHEILTLVLGEPAEVSPDFRRRIFRLGQQGTPETGGVAVGDIPPISSAITVITTEDTGVTTRIEPGHASPSLESSVAEGDGKSAEPVERAGRDEVPEYLRRASRPRIMPYVVTLVLAFLLAGVALRAMGRFDSTHPLVRMFSGEPAEVAMVNDHPHEAQPSRPDQPAETPPQPITRQDVQEAEQVERIDAATEDEAPSPQPAPDDVQPEPAPLDDGEPPDPQAVSEELDVPAADDVAPASEGAVETEAPEDALDEPTPDDSIRIPGVTEDFAPVEADQSPVEVVRDAGRVLSEDQPLFRYDEENRTWSRLATRAALKPGDDLLIPPVFRPQILLVPGLQLAFSGYGNVRIQSAADGSNPELAVAYGRVVLAPVTPESGRIRLQFGERLGTLEVDDGLAAIEVVNYLEPGADPLETQPIKVVQLFCAEGPIVWTEEGPEATSVALETGQVAVIIGDRQPEVETFAELPRWIDGRDLSDVEDLAVPELTRLLPTGRSVLLSLKEAVQHRRVEVRALAARCLAQMDDFEPFFSLDGVLRDESQRAYWDHHFEALRRALARGPESAAELQKALQRFRPADADPLFRLLWGYSPEQLEAGADAQLVAWLEHDSLDYRVLAFANLQWITGHKHGYSPHFSEVRRRGPLQAWRERLRERAIRYATPPTPVPVQLTADRSVQRRGDDRSGLPQP